MYSVMVWTENLPENELVLQSIQSGVADSQTDPNRMQTQRSQGLQAFAFCVVNGYQKHTKHTI